MPDVAWSPIGKQTANQPIGDTYNSSVQKSNFFELQGQKCKTPLMIFKNVFLETSLKNVFLSCLFVPKIKFL